MTDERRAPRPDLLRRVPTAVLAALIVFVVVASSVAVLAFTRDDGAATSEQAARDLLTAIEAGDAIGVVEQLPPGERNAVIDELSPLAGGLARTGLLATTDLDHLGGIEVSDTDLVIQTRTMAKDMDSVDLVGGMLTIRVAAGDGLLTATARRLLDPDGQFSSPDTDWTATRDLATDPVRLVAIREGGGWHVSVAYSVAEAVRNAAGVDLPEMGTGPPGSGAETPELAVRGLFEAYADADAERMVSLMYPDDARALYDFAPLFVPGARDVATKAAASGTYDVQLNDLVTATDGSGPTRTVTVSSFDIDVRDIYRKTHLRHDGRCLTVDRRVGDGDDPYQAVTVCNGDDPRDPAALTPFHNPVADLAIFGGGVDLPTFTVVERAGSWFISPVRTVLGSIVSTLGNSDANQATAFGERLRATIDDHGGERLSGDGPTDLTSDPAHLIDGCSQLTTGARSDEVRLACLTRLAQVYHVNAAATAVRDGAPAITGG